MLELLLAVALQMTLNTHYFSPNNTNPDTPEIVKLDASMPYIRAETALIMDMNSQTILYEKGMNETRQIASLTKLMTALIIIEEHKLDEIVTIPTEAVMAGGSTMYLATGENITIENLLNGLLIKSGNDAAVALAIYNAGSTDEFVKKMNAKAAQLNLTNTHFQNPMGFDNIDNYSNAIELAQLTLKLYAYDPIKKIVESPTADVYSVDKKIKHHLVNTNMLLNDYLGVRGFKTGTTGEALGCFISTTDGLHPMLTVVLGSDQRFIDTKILLDWARTSFGYF
jgi:D-alanyl-D-alanine carboxypeptidase